MDYVCSICEKIVSSRVLFCHSCYEQFKNDIMAGKEWTIYLKNLERRRRYKERHAPVLIYLNDKFDISDSGELIVRDGYRGW